MGTTQKDADAIKLAVDRGFQFGEPETGNHIVSQIFLASPPHFGDESSVLAEAIDSMNRMMGEDVTVWIDVQSNDVPDYIEPAIIKCRGKGIGIIITHAGKSTSEPGPLLSSALIESVRNAARDGMIWHPLEGKMVHCLRRHY